MATYYRYDGFLKTVNGQAIAGAQVYVCNDINVNLTNPPTPLATVYADNAGANVIVQPGGSLTTDGFGHFFFYALEGVYALVTVNAGVVRLYLPDQTIGPVGAVGLGTVTNNEGPLPANTIIVGGPSGGNDIQTSGILISNLGTVLSVAGAGIATGVVNTIGFITVVGSGSTQVAATANSNLALAPVGHVLVADGNGNVEDSGVPLSIVGGGTVTNDEGPLTPNAIVVGGPGGGNDIQTSGILLSSLGTVKSVSGAGIATGTVTGTGSITVLGSGNTTTAATANANLAAAPVGDVLVADGAGNVKDSGTTLVSLTPRACLPQPDVATFELQQVNIYGNSASYYFSPTNTNGVTIGVHQTGGSVTLNPPDSTDGWNVSLAPTSGSNYVQSAPWANPALGLTFKCTCKITSPVGTGMWWFGTNNASVGDSGGDPEWIRVPHIDSIQIGVPWTAGTIGNFQLLAGTNGTVTQIDTGVSAAGGGRHTIEFTVATGGTLLTAIIDGATVPTTISTNIPTSLQSLIAVQQWISGPSGGGSVTGTATAQVEYLYLEAPAV